jgi:hypothetical protein
MSVSTLLIGGFLLVTLIAVACPPAFAQPEELKPRPGQRAEATESTGAQSTDKQLPNSQSGGRHSPGSDRGTSDSVQRSSDPDRRSIDADTAGLGDRLQRLEEMSRQGGGTDLEQETQTNIPDIPKDKQKRIELRFGGSLCPTCLVYFEKKLYETGAIVQVEMAVAKKRPGQLAKVAIATVDYDPAKINKAQLIELVKHNDFQFMEATDREIK